MSGAGTRRHYTKIEKAHGCTIWDGAVNNDGYPVKRHEGKIVLVHRLKAGALNSSKDVHHTCNNRRCINPAHLKVLSHKDNMGETDRANKQTCKYGHSLKDAYIFTDARGDKHRQCRKCKIQREVSKHLEGRHDQSLHGNWASKVAGTISPEKKRELQTKLRGRSRGETIENIAKWMKSHDDGISLMSWVASNGDILDLDVGTASRAPEFKETDNRGKERRRMKFVAAFDQIMMGSPHPSGKRPFPPDQDRLQRVANLFFGNLKSRQDATDVVVKIGRGSQPEPSDVRSMINAGIKRSHYVGRDGKTRSVEINADSIRNDTEYQLWNSVRGFTGWRVFHKYKAKNPDGTLKDAINLKETQGQSALPRVSGSDVSKAYDEAFEVVSARNPGIIFRVDGVVKNNRIITVKEDDYESLADDRVKVIKSDQSYEDFVKLSPNQHEMRVLFYGSTDEEVSKHLLGRHDQKTHGHKRSEHKFIKEMVGKINLFVSETKKDPNLRPKIDHKKYHVDTGRDLAVDLNMATAAAELIKDRSLETAERVAIRRNILDRNIDLQELEDFWETIEREPKEGAQAIVEGIRENERARGNKSVPAPDKDLIQRYTRNAEVTAAQFKAILGRNQQARPLVAAAEQRRQENLVVDPFNRNVIDLDEELGPSAIDSFQDMWAVV